MERWEKDRRDKKEETKVFDKVSMRQNSKHFQEGCSVVVNLLRRVKVLTSRSTDLAKIF